MGYWGDRAKDGDSPLDYFGEFEDTGKKPNTFLKKKLKADEDQEFALLGCATLMIEAGHKVDSALLTTIYEKAKKAGEVFCEVDQKFVKAYSQGTILKNKPYRVLVEINVEAIDEIDALTNAGEYARNLERWHKNSNKKVQVEVRSI